MILYTYALHIAFTPPWLPVAFYPHPDILASWCHRKTNSAWYKCGIGTEEGWSTMSKSCPIFNVHFHKHPHNEASHNTVIRNMDMAKYSESKYIYMYVPSPGISQISLSALIGWGNWIIFLMQRQSHWDTHIFGSQSWLCMHTGTHWGYLVCAQYTGWSQQIAVLWKYKLVTSRHAYTGNVSMGTTYDPTHVCCT